MQASLSDKTFVLVSRGVAYFRVWGYGLWLGSYTRHPKSFSERYGHVTVLVRLGDWRVKVLKP